jgi:hypothetical protein
LFFCDGIVFLCLLQLLYLSVDGEFLFLTLRFFVRDALQPAFERHGLSLDDVDVYLRSSKTPLGHDYDTYYLGGQHVRIEAKGVVSPDGDVGRKRRSFSSILSRARPFSRKSKVDHHHRINEVTSYITCNYCKDK